MLIKACRPKKKFYLPNLAPYYKTAAAGLGLQTSLAAFWSLENTSWTDDTGNGNTLTPSNTPTAVAAKVGNGASFTAASSQSLTVASNAGLQIGGGSFSIQAWINSSSGPGANGYLSKNDGGFANREWGFGGRFNGSAVVFSWDLYDSSSTAYHCDSATTVAAGWHHIVMTWDGTTQKIYVDSGTASTNVPGAVGISSTSAIFFGKDSDTGAFSTAILDQVGIWKGRVLSAGDVTALYNSGAGLTYAAMA
jgi:hypothetical protein